MESPKADDILIYTCLACLMESSTKLKPICGEDNEDLVTKIEECGGIKINQDDEYPKQICHNCYAFLNIAHRFRTTCQRSQEELRRRLQIKTVVNNVKKENLDGFENVLLAHVDYEYLEDQFVKAEELNFQEAQEDILELSIDLKVKTEKTSIKNTSLNPKTRKSKNQNKSTQETAELGKVLKKGRKRKIKPTENIADQSNENVLNASKKIKPIKQKDTLICHECGNKYANKQHLHAHLKQHRSVMERENECEICAKRFTTARHLQIHMNTHTGNRPFKCKYCSSAFGDPSSRIKHEHAHDNIRPYKCNVCEKAFTYSFALTNHRRIHTGEKPYSCSYCQKCFTQQHHKKTHELTHTKQLNKN